MNLDAPPRRLFVLSLFLPFSPVASVPPTQTPSRSLSLKANSRSHQPTLFGRSAGFDAQNSTNKASTSPLKALKPTTLKSSLTEGKVEQSLQGNIGLQNAVNSVYSGDSKSRPEVRVWVGTIRRKAIKEDVWQDLDLELRSKHSCLPIWTADDEMDDAYNHFCKQVSGFCQSWSLWLGRAAFSLRSSGEFLICLMSIGHGIMRKMST